MCTYIDTIVLVNTLCILVCDERDPVVDDSDGNSIEHTLSIPPHTRTQTLQTQQQSSDIMQRSILGQLLPEAMVCFLENHGPVKFSETFLGEFDNPEAIWNSEMRCCTHVCCVCMCACCVCELCYVMSCVSLWGL